ncbi:beta-1,4-mannosyltransferase egh-like isoform X2 [Artemia franciscana]|uniref:beta-1,4-mannosyltransferase egh-like isoform X2 n=1 Tax=Artemia franciscana TaxID=6661 RepID=UPI0032DA2508
MLSQAQFHARSVHTFSMKNPSSDEIPLLSETELELEKCVPSLSSRLKHYIHCACMTLVIFLFLVAGGSISVPYITLVKHIPEFDPIDNYGTWLTLSLYITKCIALLALPQVIFNFMGLLKYRAFPDKPILKSSPILGPFICIRVVTRGDTPNLVRKSVEHNLKTCLKAGLENFIVEVVCDLPVGLPEHRRVRETIVPSRYKPSSGCLFKARALQYCLEDDVNDLADSDWIVHLDEETRLTEDAVKGILNFVTSGEHQFGQGLITYTHITMKNVIITLCDTFRVAEDLGKLRYQFKAWHAPFFGMKGSYVVSQVGAEKLVSFNHGPDGSIAEDCFFSIVAASKGYSFDFIEGEMWEQSPFTVKDFLEQRKRWLQGILLTVHSSVLPWKNKWLLAISLYSWITMPISTSNVFLAPLYPIPMPWVIDFAINFIGGMNLYLYIYGVIMSFSIKKIGIFKFILYIIGAIASTPLKLVIENLAVVYGLLTNKYRFYIVKKELEDYTKVPAVSLV